MAKDNRSPSNQARPPARSEGTELVASPAHEWELPISVLKKPASRSIAITTIAKLMASGEWRTGVTAGQLARSWGICLGTVSSYAGIASRDVKGSVDRDALQRIANESIERLMETGYEARASNELGVAVMAFTKAADLCANILKNSNEKDPKKQTEQDAFKRLVELGWAPPKVMLGLPKPDLMDPEKDE